MNDVRIPLSASTWPIIELNEVFHIGQLDPALKGKTHNSTSLEGNGLSVSVNPDAWRQIASLGGEPTWSMRTAGNGRFLDVHALNAGHWTQVMDWSTKNEFLSPAKVLVVSWYDEDAGVTTFIEFDGEDLPSAAAAQVEFDLCEHPDPKIEIKSGFKASNTLNSRMGFAVDLSLARHLALTVYIEDVLFEELGIHGAWWEDDLDVFAFSAPRGVIHGKALGSWEKKLFEPEKQEKRSNVRPR